MLAELRPSPRGLLSLGLESQGVHSLNGLHLRCRNEVARADSHLAETVIVFRKLVEIEIARVGRTPAAAADYRWRLASAWMMNNLSIHAPVPALCDYLRMSPSTLHRFLRRQVAQSLGEYFREMKSREPRRIIQEGEWQVKALAYDLGYRHPNNLGRALSGQTPSVRDG